MILPNDLRFGADARVSYFKNVWPNGTPDEYFLQDGIDRNVAFLPDSRNVRHVAPDRDAPDVHVLIEQPGMCLCLLAFRSDANMHAPGFDAALADFGEQI